ncbi:MAG: restriction endonuclease subunit S, partial [Candidatus Woesearchaeota archaeon]
HISKEYIKKIMIIYPEKKETQQKIVSILEKAEQLKELRKQADELTDTFLKAVFYEMFGNRKKFEEVELGKIAPLQGGFAFKSSDYKKEGIRLIKINNVLKDTLNWEDITYLPKFYLEKYSEFSLFENDIVLSMTRPIIKSLDSVKIAKVRNNDLPCLLNQRVGRFKINKKLINSFYLLFYCYTDTFKKEIEKLCSTSLQPNVSSFQVNEIKIPLPPLHLQQKFASIVNEVESIKEKQKQSKENIDSLFNSLMQKAFRGELIA